MFISRYIGRTRRFIALIRQGFGDYTGRMIVMFLLIVSSGILEGIGMNAVIPLFSYISGGPDARSDAISRFIDQLFRLLHITPTVKHLLVFMTVLFIGKALLLFLSHYVTLRIMIAYEKRTMSEVFRRMLKSTWPYLSKHKVGYLDYVLLTDVDRSSGMLFHLSLLMLVLANACIYGLLILNISPAIALLALMFGGIVFFFMKPLFYRNRIMSERIASYHKEIAHAVGEHVLGMKSVKAFAVEDDVHKKYRSLFVDFKNLRFRVELLKQATGASIQPIALLFIIGVFAFFYKTNAFHIASFAVVVYALNRVFGSLQLIQAEFHDLNSRIPHLRNLLAYQEEARRNEERKSGTLPFSFQKSLEFRDVRFRYGDDMPLLDNIRFTVRPGELIGLIGPSGAGKTTIVDLLLRLLEPESGTIAIDGTDIRSIDLIAWRGHVGYVSQDTFLLNDTIANNIRFYADDMPDDVVREAAKTAQIYDMVMRQSKQFDTVVGERGVRLSGGERQRIALARVLARQPSILILDEATSALDRESEALIQEAIEQLKGTITVFAIAHRLSTIAHFDRIMVLAEGRIVEDGPPEELLQNPSSYYAKALHMA